MLKDVLAVLASTPEKIQGEISTLSARELKTPPAPGKWSIQLVLAHLADVEELGMRGRVEAMVNQDLPRFASYDQEARVLEGRYDRKDPRRTLASFAQQRRANVKWLARLKPAQLKRRGIHERVGEITVEELLCEWAFHDLGHLKQILEIKRRAFFPRMGNMRAFYPSS